MAILSRHVAKAACVEVHPPQPVVWSSNAPVAVGGNPKLITDSLECPAVVRVVKGIPNLILWQWSLYLVQNPPCLVVRVEEI